MPTASIPVFVPDISSACLSSADGQPANKSMVKTVAKTIVMAFDKENTIFFDTEYPHHKETMEKSIEDKISYFNVYIILTFPKEAGRHSVNSPYRM